MVQVTNAGHLSVTYQSNCSLQVPVYLYLHVPRIVQKVYRTAAPLHCCVISAQCVHSTHSMFTSLLTSLLSLYTGLLGSNQTLTVALDHYVVNAIFL